MADVQVTDIRVTVDSEGNLFLGCLTPDGSFRPVVFADDTGALRLGDPMEPPPETAPPEDVVQPPEEE